MEKVQLTDGLCCTCSCRSNSYHILSSHWHIVIAWGRIWRWLKGEATSPSCTSVNVQIFSSGEHPSPEMNLVLCDVSPWASTCLLCVSWILKEREKQCESENTAHPVNSLLTMLRKSILCSLVMSLGAKSLKDVGSVQERVEQGAVGGFTL